MLAQQGDLLVDWSVEAQAPVGVVALGAGADEARVRLVDERGGEVDADGNGAEAVAVELTDLVTGEVRRFERNAEGHFYQIYQPNKWVKLMKEREAAAAARM